MHARARRAPAWLIVLSLLSLSLSCKFLKKPAPEDAGSDAAPAETADAAPAVEDAAPPEVPDAAAPIPTATATAAPATFATGQVWSGSYTCQQGLTSLTLRIRQGAPTVDAIFDFVTKTKTHGSFNSTGTYIPASRHLTLVGGAWISRPSGFITVNLDGALSADGHTYSGLVRGAPGCTVFNVRR